MGLMSRWQGWLLPRVAVVSSCSAGACVITTLLSGRRAEAREFWLRRAGTVRRNFDWSRLLRGQRPAPQGEIYRETLLVTFRDGGLERIKSQPFPILILASLLPRILPTAASVALGLTLYSIERGLKKG